MVRWRSRRVVGRSYVFSALGFWPISFGCMIPGLYEVIHTPSLSFLVPGLEVIHYILSPYLSFTHPDGDTRSISPLELKDLNRLKPVYVRQWTKFMRASGPRLLSSSLSVSLSAAGFTGCPVPLVSHSQCEPSPHAAAHSCT